MQKDLYFDVVSDEGAGGLYMIKTNLGGTTFYYQYTSSDLETDRITNTETNYPDFVEFWKAFTKNKRWFTLHPLYIHPEQRPFIKEELQKVNWKVVTDEKWRDMYQRQWNKVLNNPSEYYKPLK